MEYWCIVLLFFVVVVVVLFHLFPFFFVPFICRKVGIIWNENSVRLRLFHIENCSVESETVIVQVITLIFYIFRFVCFVLLHLSLPVYLFLLSLSLHVNFSHSFSPWLYLSKYLSLLLTFFSFSLSPAVMGLTSR